MQNTLRDESEANFEKMAMDGKLSRQDKIGNNQGLETEETHGRQKGWPITRIQPPPFPHSKLSQKILAGTLKKIVFLLGKRKKYP